jgi:hypothetical protein
VYFTEENKRRIVMRTYAIAYTTLKQHGRAKVTENHRHEFPAIDDAEAIAKAPAIWETLLREPWAHFVSLEEVRKIDWQPTEFSRR